MDMLGTCLIGRFPKSISPRAGDLSGYPSNVSPIDPIPYQVPLDAAPKYPRIRALHTAKEQCHSAVPLPRRVNKQVRRKEFVPE